MRRNWRSNRLILLIVCLILCFGLIGASGVGLLAPAENLLSVPMNALSGLFTRLSFAISGATGDYNDLQALQARNAELETTLAQLQGELIQLREVASDYERLVGLLEYTSSTADSEYLTADVIGQDQYAFVRSIIINKGTRDGIAVGMPVVTDLGLVGRIYKVSANAAQVQLITDQNSFVSGRLQTSRAEGSVQGRGLEAGDLRMQYISLDATITEGDLVVTSGLGGNFPPDLVIGQVTSIQNLEFQLWQEAQVTSLIDFGTLEFVLVVTSFEPADLSVFDAVEEE